ncbi:MAG: hypothetical protein BWY39_00600 [Spirochaetes bacterium ADurb.Bin269]|nr:MAG: hypothetical protein BWY39_00600 [Spirochaetes bacterium ADurb.Bin269]
MSAQNPDFMRRKTPVPRFRTGVFFNFQRAHYPARALTRARTTPRVQPTRARTNPCAQPTRARTTPRARSASDNKIRRAEPQFFKIIKRTGCFGHQMYNHIPQIDQHPIITIGQFPARRTHFKPKIL